MVTILTKNSLRITQRKVEGLNTLQYLSSLCNISDIEILWDSVAYVVHCTLDDLIKYTDDQWEVE